MSDTSPEPYYRHHIFFCTRDRGDGRESCAAHGGSAALAHCKAAVKAAGLAGPGGVRVNETSCLDRCTEGPVAVVYPGGVWYTFVDDADIDEVVDAHLAKDTVVARLALRPDPAP
ncbi:MAG: 2Fe-2S ferredoxin [Rhodoferax sp.]|nr:2Fe-2S ferredoxin [Rhodoferax sp.]